MTNSKKNPRKRRMAREPSTKVAPAQCGTDNNPAPAITPTEPKALSKTGNVLALLQRAGGATLDEMVAATGWLPHTTRAALAGLRKKGHADERTKVDGISRYAIAGPAAK